MDFLKKFAKQVKEAQGDNLARLLQDALLKVGAANEVILREADRTKDGDYANSLKEAVREIEDLTRKMDVVRKKVATLTESPEQ